jgi:hypothetical protein
MVKDGVEPPIFAFQVAPDDRCQVLDVARQAI